MRQNSLMQRGKLLVSSTKNYTLDRIEDGFAVFLQRPDEEHEFIIAVSELPTGIEAGAIVQITQANEQYCIENLPQEALSQKERIKALMAQLRNKNKK